MVTPCKWEDKVFVRDTVIEPEEPWSGEPGQDFPVGRHNLLGVNNSETDSTACTG